MYAQTFHQGFLGHVAYADLRCPDGGLITDGMTSQDINLNGSYIPDGTPDHANFGGFGIDYSTNPPRVISDLVYTGSPGTVAEAGGNCGEFPSQLRDLGPGARNFGLGLTFGDPATLGGSGDTQVRIDSKGHFVITGMHDSSVSIPTCVTPVPPAFGVIPCQSTGSSTNIDAEHDVWTLRPHVECPPIPADKLTDPTVANDLKDDDGDGIPNCWEQHGIQIQKPDGSVITYPLPGANPARKTLFVEVDFMQGHQPAGGTLSDVVRAFAAAPVGNVDGSRGIDLYAQLGEAVPEVPQLSFDGSPSRRPERFLGSQVRDGVDRPSGLRARIFRHPGRAGRCRLRPGTGGEAARVSLCARSPTTRQHRPAALPASRREDRATISWSRSAAGGRRRSATRGARRGRRRARSCTSSVTPSASATGAATRSTASRTI